MNGKQKKRLLLATVAALLVPAGVTVAEVITPVNQAGRIFGAGWGDGYHACKSSGLRIGADLPPPSYSQLTAGPRSRPVHQAAHRAAGTFYDRFDSLRSHLHHHPSDEVCCDSNGIMIDGSQVIQKPTLAPSPRTPRPSESGPQLAESRSRSQTFPAPYHQATRPVPVRPAPPPPRRAPPITRLPRTQLGRAAEAGPAEIATLAEVEFRRTATPKSIRPHHPGYRFAGPTEQLIEAALGRDFVMPSRPPVASDGLTSPAHSTPSGKTAHRVRLANPMIAVVSKTPNAIAPVHPGFAPGPSRADLLVRAALGDDFRMPLRASQTAGGNPATTSIANAPRRTSTPADIRPQHPYDRPTTQPGEPTAIQTTDPLAVRRQRLIRAALGGEFKMTAPTPPTFDERSATSQSAQREPEQIGRPESPAEPMPPRVAQSALAPPVAPDVLPPPLMPLQLGEAEFMQTQPRVQINPLAYPRADVDLATRRPAAEANVVRQPH